MQDAHVMHHAITPATASGDFMGLLVTLFIVGFSGGFAHCAFMCGPFVLAQVGNRLQTVSSAKMSELSRLQGAALLPYHLGRMTTYAILGGIVATIVQGTSHLWNNITNILLFIAGSLMVLTALASIFNKFYKLKLSIFNGIGNKMLSAKLGRIIAPLMASPVGFKGYLLGIILGFLPCGMIYAALGVAASTAIYWQGMAVMVAFALGTIPALVIVGLLGNLMLGKFKNNVIILSKVVTLLAGVWLCIIAL